MKHLTRAAIAGFALAMAVSATPAAAQDSNMNKTTFLKFSGPVELPNLQLPAGEYMFRLADIPGQRHIVEVKSRDGMKHLATILAMSATRSEPTGETVITFRETAAGAPAAIRYWFYPGNVIGHEFVYPRKQAIQIAKTSGQDVLMVEDDGGGSVERMTAAEVTSINPEGEESPRPSEAAAASATIAQSEPERTMASNTVGTSGSLPKTASPLPLFGLFGFLSLAGALSVRALRKAGA